MRAIAKQRFADAAGTGGNDNTRISPMRTKKRGKSVAGQCQLRETAGGVDEVAAVSLDNGARESQTDRALIVTPVAKLRRLEGAVNGAKNVGPRLIDPLAERGRSCLSIGEKISTHAC